MTIDLVYWEQGLDTYPVDSDELIAINTLAFMSHAEGV